MKIEEDGIKVGNVEWFYRHANPINASDRLPVVLLHGIPAQSYTWGAIVPELASQGFRAIAPDWLGHGRSAKPDKRDFAYTPDAYLQAFADFLQALDIDRCSLVVQGFLGSVGIQYALRNPDRVDRLAILNTPISTQAKLPWKMQQMSLPFIGDMMTQDPLLVDRTLESGSKFVVSDADLDVYRRPFLKSSDSGRSLLMTLRHLNLPSAMTEIETGLPQWKNPLLIVWGVNDPWLDIEPAQTLANQSNTVELVKLPEAAHYPQEHWSNEISESLLTFLRRQ
jgi:pimeloyl-ACP methyl ester carboxylesterase